MRKPALLGFVVMVLGACSSSEPTPAPAPAEDAGTIEQGTPFTIWVFEQHVFPGDPDVPLAGATVAWDPPGGGERVEVTTEADGHVTVHGDFAKGDGTATVFAKDHVLVSVLHTSPAQASTLPPNPVGKPATDLVLFAQLNQIGLRPKRMEVPGTVTGRTAEEAVVVLTPTIHGIGAGTAPDGNFALTVPKDRPFAIIGHAFTEKVTGREMEGHPMRMFRVERPAASAPAPLDIDIAASVVTPTLLHYRIELPGGDTGPLGSTSFAFAHVFSLDSFALVGPAVRSKLTPDNNAFDVEVNHAPGDLPGEQIATRAIVRMQDQSLSIRFELGAQPDNTTFKDFLVPVPVVVEKQTIADPISVDGFPANASAQVALRQGQDDYWLVFDEFEKSPSAPLKIPAPPTGVRLPATLSAVVIAASNDATDVNPGGRLPKAVAISRPFTVTTK